MGSSDPIWWDRDVDRAGRTLRPDVRAAAHAIWRSASRQAQSVTSDCSQAADLMEGAVVQISRYLDHRGVVPFSREIRGLLMLAFQRTLRRRMARLRRFETLGGTAELSGRAVDREWARQVHAHLELEQVVGMLSDRSREILALRYAGYTWKETSRMLGPSVSAVRTAFWRDVARVRSELMNNRCNGVGRKARGDSAVTNDPGH
jgi:DNA-directed RNA polymerase specialized sigma24 family protein